MIFKPNKFERPFENKPDDNGRSLYEGDESSGLEAQLHQLRDYQDIATMGIIYSINANSPDKSPRQILFDVIAKYRDPENDVYPLQTATEYFSDRNKRADGNNRTIKLHLDMPGIEERITKIDEFVTSLKTDERYQDPKMLPIGEFVEMSNHVLRLTQGDRAPQWHYEKSTDKLTFEN